MLGRSVIWTRASSVSASRSCQRRGCCSPLSKARARNQSLWNVFRTPPRYLARAVPNRQCTTSGASDVPTNAQNSSLRASPLERSGISPNDAQSLASKRAWAARPPEAPKPCARASPSTVLRNKRRSSRLILEPPVAAKPTASGRAPGSNPVQLPGPSSRKSSISLAAAGSGRRGRRITVYTSPSSAISRNAARNCPGRCSRTERMKVASLPGQIVPSHDVA